jgi:hypothetical protein
MLGRQTITQPHGQIQRLLVVHRFKCSLHAQQYTTTDQEYLLLSDKLLGPTFKGRGVLEGIAHALGEYQVGNQTRVLSLREDRVDSGALPLRRLLPIEEEDVCWAHCSIANARVLALGLVLKTRYTLGKRCAGDERDAKFACQYL